MALNAMAKTYAAIAVHNRSKVLANLRATGVSVGAVYLRGGSIQTRRWTDSELPFRQESFFYYLTGLNEPDSHVVINISTGLTTLLVPNHDADHAMWMGPSPSLDDYRATFPGCSVTFTENLGETLASSGASTAIHILDEEEPPSSTAAGPIVTTNLRDAIVEARVFKSLDEVAIMRAAGRISGEAHIALMKSNCQNEMQLHAKFVAECLARGAAQAYTPIAAGGRNASTLHYVKNDEPLPMNKNELVLIDAGCELGCYASDITRCWPIGGKFEGDFKTIYEIVLDMQKRVLAEMKPGVLWEHMHRLAESVALTGLLKAGIIQGSREDLLRNHIPALFFPHGLGHLLGIDTHDCGGYPKGVERIQEPGIRYLRMRRPLTPGMVVTVEPGIYFVSAILEKAIADPNLNKFLNLPVLHRYWKSVGGVRIEDDVFITETGIDNLTGWVPKEIADVEKAMASA